MDMHNWSVKKVNICCGAQGETALLQEAELEVEQERALIVPMEEAARAKSLLEGQGLEVRLWSPEELTAGAVCSGEACGGQIWLTDNAAVLGQLAEAGRPVVAWLHEGNGQEDFSRARYAVTDIAEVEADFYDKIYCRYAGLPWEIARTERCIIRETTEADVDAFLVIYADPEMTRYTESFDREAATERAAVREYMEKVYDFYGYGVWSVVLAESGEVIGRVGFEQGEVPYLGYMIGRPWQRQGLAEEVCRAVLALAEEQLGFAQVRLKIHPDNLASVKLAQKLGFSECESDSASAGWLSYCRNGRIQDVKTAKED